jgi:cell division protein FtsQ
MSQANRRRTPPRFAGMGKRLLHGLGHGLMIALLLGLIGGSGWWLNRSLVVHAWEIHGVPEGMQAAIGEQLKHMQPLDLLHAWPSRLQADLLQHLPDLAEVNITRILPDRLEITATMRQPVALWRGKQGTVQLVDGMGVAYRPLKAGEMLDLPLLRMPEDDLQESATLLLRLKQMDATRYARLSELISEDGGWRLNFDQGRCWLLPRGAQAETRMQQVLALLQEDRWKEGDWRIDARATTRWFIRKSKSGGMV